MRLSQCGELTPQIELVNIKYIKHNKLVRRNVCVSSSYDHSMYRVYRWQEIILFLSSDDDDDDMASLEVSILTVFSLSTFLLSPFVFFWTEFLQLIFKFQCFFEEVIASEKTFQQQQNVFFLLKKFYSLIYEILFMMNGKRKSKVSI